MGKGIPEMPTELMSRMAHSTRAMDGFFSLSRNRQEALAEYIQSAPDENEAKSRIEEATEALEHPENPCELR